MQLFSLSYPSVAVSSNGEACTLNEKEHCRGKTQREIKDTYICYLNPIKHQL